MLKGESEKSKNNYLEKSQSSYFERFTKFGGGSSKNNKHKGSMKSFKNNNPKKSGYSYLESKRKDFKKKDRPSYKKEVFEVIDQPVENEIIESLQDNISESKNSVAIQKKQISKEEEVSVSNNEIDDWINEENTKVLEYFKKENEEYFDELNQKFEVKYEQKFQDYLFKFEKPCQINDDNIDHSNFKSKTDLFNSNYEDLFVEKSPIIQNDSSALISGIGINFFGDEIKIEEKPEQKQKNEKEIVTEAQPSLQSIPETQEEPKEDYLESEVIYVKGTID